LTVTTDYQAKYIAYELTRRHPTNSVEKLASALVDAQVDLNPHQVDAAMFAFQSPLSNGALLADEVGLGKTIEAGLVLSQNWAERKRKILIITPSNLRKQWYQELSEKFFLPCRILESKSYNASIKLGKFRPFDTLGQDIVICSYQFARSKASDVSALEWDLVVIDEAHRLRNVYKPSNVTARTLQMALANRRKLLLTATPLQNSLLELFGLVSFIDEHLFGDLKSFKEQFQNLSQQQVFATLQHRLKPVCHRTLRRQVLAYVNYTDRIAILQNFTPSESEDRLYDLVSEYLRRPNLQALPSSQRTLMTLVLRKLLASSTFAIAGALDTLMSRMKLKLRSAAPEQPLEEELEEDYEALDETAEEWDGEDDETEPLTAEDRAALSREIEDLRQFRDLALSIDQNAKGRALLIALKKAFEEAQKVADQRGKPKVPRKAIIFTESRKTQNYLLRIFADSPHAGKVVMFNGSNNDDRSKEIYAAWAHKNEGTDKVTGSRTADMRSALVDYFRDEGEIMIATEAGAEGINLQFCSLVVNYDLPWNPQRIEQRIGRCHRYGQEFDVVVVNFVNQNNAADRRVFELLDQKFQLFKGVFGASDEVLGAIESGVDFEKRISDIYQRCRHPEEIAAAFDQLQQELSEQIGDSMRRTRQTLLENFDDEVREKLRLRNDESRQYLGIYEQRLMQLTRYELREKAEFRDDDSFILTRKLNGDGIPAGLYELPRRSGHAHLYRLQHPLGQYVVNGARGRELPPAEIELDYQRHAGKISVLDSLRGQRGWLRAECLTIESLDLAEDHIIVTAVDDCEQLLDDETSRRLLTLPARVLSLALGAAPATLEKVAAARREAIQAQISSRNAKFFDEEAEKLDDWADDKKLALSRAIKELDKQIKEARREARASGTLEEKLRLQKTIRTLESQRSDRRKAMEAAEDEIDRQRDTLITTTEAKLNQNSRLQPLFLVRWRLT
jgi:superfamily II DNA or RNA helicase